MLQMRSWGRGSGGGAPGSATIVAGAHAGRRWRWRWTDGVARRVATPFSESSRRELTMSHGRAQEGDTQEWENGETADTAG
jgi:hypothetical protein